MLVPRKKLHLMRLNDADAETVGRKLKHGDPEMLGDLLQVVGTMEFDDGTSCRRVPVRRTLDSHGNLVTEHRDGRQDVRIYLPSAGSQASAQTPGPKEG